MDQNRQIQIFIITSNIHLDSWLNSHDETTQDFIDHPMIYDANDSDFKKDWTKDYLQEK